MKSSNPPGTICLQENNMNLVLLLLSTTLALFHDNHDFDFFTDGDQHPDHDNDPDDIEAASSNFSKVLDFSTDGDQFSNYDNVYTGATLDAGPLPESFTICSAIMVDAWTSGFAAADMFTLLSDGYKWMYLSYQIDPSYTKYEVRVGPAFHTNQTDAVLFPLQWTRACVSLDSSKITVVVNGQLLVNETYRKGEDWPVDLNFRLGFDVDQFGYAREFPVKIADLNVFKSSLSVQRMIGMTTAGGDECGASGNLLSWEEAEWTLHSQAKVIEVDCNKHEMEIVFWWDF